MNELNYTLANAYLDLNWETFEFFFFGLDVVERLNMKKEIGEDARFFNQEIREL